MVCELLAPCNPIHLLAVNDMIVAGVERQIRKYHDIYPTQVLVLYIPRSLTIFTYLPVAGVNVTRFRHY